MILNNIKSRKNEKNNDSIFPTHFWLCERK